MRFVAKFNLLTSTMALIGVAAPALAQGWVLRYEETFDTDPFNRSEHQWHQDDPTRQEVQWENGHLRCRISNCPGNAAWTDFDWHGESFRLEWEWSILSCEWSSAANFGLYGEEMIIYENGIICDMGLVDQGYHISLMASSDSQSVLRDAWDRWSPPQRCVNSVEYDATNGNTTLVVRNADTGVVLSELSLEAPPSFPQSMDYLGISRRHMNCYNHALTDFTLDNIRLYTQSEVSLTADGTCPNGGPIQIRWSGATPNGQAALIFAACEGSFIVPARHPCQGTQLGLGDCQIHVAWSGRSDGTGSKALNSTAGAGACDKFLQLLDLTTCTTSNVATIE